MVDEFPKYMIDVWCFVCEHPWGDHYEKGCYHIINKDEVLQLGARRKFCECAERVNRVHTDPIVREFDN